MDISPTQMMSRNPLIFLMKVLLL